MSVVGPYAFMGCSGLTTVNISNGVTKLDAGAFGLCTGLTTVTIPQSMTDVGEYAFYGCTGLKRITCNAKNAPNAYNTTFGEVETSKVLLLVPDGYDAQYRTHSIWKQFWIETPTGVSPLGETEEGAAIYNLAGQRVNKMQKGSNIVNGRKVLVK